MAYTKKAGTKKRVAAIKVAPSFETQIQKIDEVKSKLSREIDRLNKLVDEQKRAGIEALATTYLKTGKIDDAVESEVKRFNEEQSTLEAKRAVFNAILPLLIQKAEQLKRENMEQALKSLDEQIQKKEAQIKEAKGKTEGLGRELEELKAERRLLART